MSQATQAQKVFLRGASTVEQHAAAHNADPDAYAAELIRLLRADVELSSSTRVRGAAVCWRAGQRHVVDAVLASKHTNVADVLALVKLLDAERQLRALDHKLSRSEDSGEQNGAKRRKLSALKQQRNDIVAAGTLPSAGPSATSSLARRVRRWVKSFPQERLLFFLLNFSMQPWRELADLTHLRPSNFALHYFLPVAFGAKPPEDSVLHEMRSLSSPEALPALLAKHPELAECYSFLRTQFSSGGGKTALAEPARRALAMTAPLSDLIWFYEEMHFDGIDTLVAQRMDSGEAIADATGKNRDSFGKLMERLLLLRKRKAGFLSQLQRYAEAQFEGVCVPTRKRVAVLGDASASMQVAVESATIIGSVVCSALGGRLTFFNNKDFAPPVQPRSVADVLKVTDAVRAGSSTAPAASLVKFLDEGQVVDLFIVVTDEEENCDARGHWQSDSKKTTKRPRMFADVFKEYLDKVNPQASVFFVSFIADTAKEGDMMKSMAEAGLAERCQQFRFHPQRPDLSKLGSLLAILAEQTAPDDEDDAAASASASASATPSEVRRTCAEADVPLLCQDGTLLVTEAQDAAVRAAFTDVDEIPMQTLLRALPKLRIGGQGSPDDAASVSTAWTVVSSKRMQ